MYQFNNIHTIITTCYICKGNIASPFTPVDVRVQVVPAVSLAAALALAAAVVVVRMLNEQTEESAKY